ncbi:MAG: iron-containing alcohol dehydrogenase [Chloroflexi bacterium]|nr:iron-containing alcohol dehydrogenase [Chloroflexota bacterium]
MVTETGKRDAATQERTGDVPYGDVATFVSPTRVLFGVGAVDTIGAEIRALDGRRVLLVTEPGVAAAGLAARVERPIRDAGFEVTTFDRVVPNPDVEGVDSGAALARQIRADVLVGVGGGSALDTAKLIGLLVAEGGDSIYRYFADPVVTRPILPLVAVPTTAGTGSEVAWAAIVNRKSTGERLSLGSPHLAARVAVVDPAFSAGLPSRLAAGTGMDALAHSIEGYTSTRANPFGDAMAAEAIRRIGRGLVARVTEPGNLANAALMASAATMGGFVLNLKGVNLGHAMGRSLSTWYGIHHGTAVGALLPTIMAFNMVGNEVRFAQVARLLGVQGSFDSEAELARAGVERVREIQRLVAIPGSLRALDVPRGDLDRLTDAVVTNPALTATNPRPIDRNAIRALYDELLC